MEIIKIGAMGIVGVMLAVWLKTVKPEYGIYVGMAAGLLIFGYTLHTFSFFMDEVEKLHTLLGEDTSFFAILLKVVGITYICEFCAGICKDAGYGAVGGQIEIFGKVMVLLSGLPVLLSVIETIQGFKG